MSAPASSTRTVGTSRPQWGVPPAQRRTSSCMGSLAMLCIGVTLKLYATHKGIALGRCRCAARRSDRVHPDDCTTIGDERDEPTGWVDRIQSPDVTIHGHVQRLPRESPRLRDRQVAKRLVRVQAKHPGESVCRFPMPVVFSAPPDVRGLDRTIESSTIPTVVSTNAAYRSRRDLLSSSPRTPCCSKRQPNVPAGSERVESSGKARSAHLRVLAEVSPLVVRLRVEVRRVAPGWPSFFAPIEGHLRTKTDFKLVLPRTLRTTPAWSLWPASGSHVRKDGPREPSPGQRVLQQRCRPLVRARRWMTRPRCGPKLSRVLTKRFNFMTRGPFGRMPSSNLDDLGCLACTAQQRLQPSFQSSVLGASRKSDSVRMSRSCTGL